MERLPRRLKKEPLIEVIWQAQFEDSQATGDVLPGILFAQLRKDYPDLQLRRLPLADIPSPIAEIDPNLRFAPKMLMEQPEIPLIWQVGDRVITLNCRKPYLGWDKFKEAIIALTKTVENTKLVGNLRRHSLRYIDLLTGELGKDISSLKLAVNLGNHEIKDRMQIRVEIVETQCVHVVQIVTGARANLEGQRLTGLIVDLETLPTDQPVTWEVVRTQLDLLHEHSKALFFGQILTQEAIERLDPEY